MITYRDKNISKKVIDTQSDQVYKHLKYFENNTT